MVNQWETDKTRRLPEKLRSRLVSSAGWTGGHPTGVGNFSRLRSLHALAARFVGIRLGHTLGLLVAHRHLALLLIGLRRGLRLETIVHIILARLAFELLLAGLSLTRLHLFLLRVGGVGGISHAGEDAQHA